MKSFSLKISASCILLLSLFVSNSILGQTKYQSAGGMKITIEGTSNIHDWVMKSDKGTSSGVFYISKSGLLTGMSALSFSVPAKSLKSSHKGMDKNTYKALNTDKYASICFISGPANIKSSGDSGYVLIAKGKLTISGVTKDILLKVTGNVNADKSISYSGSYKLKMTDYNVEPPRAMLGAITTGDNVVVKFNVLFKEI